MPLCVIEELVKRLLEFAFYCQCCHCADVWDRLWCYLAKQEKVPIESKYYIARRIESLEPVESKYYIARRIETLGPIRAHRVSPPGRYVHCNASSMWSEVERTELRSFWNCNYSIRTPILSIENPTFLTKTVPRPRKLNRTISRNRCCSRFYVINVKGLYS